MSISIVSSFTLETPEFMKTIKFNQAVASLEDKGLHDLEASETEWSVWPTLKKNLVDITLSKDIWWLQISTIVD